MPRKKRDDFPKMVIQSLRDRVGGLCSQPLCRKPTTGPDAYAEDKATIIGIAAHICAASPGGPRYDPSQTESERCSFENGIWLCASCATLIDKNDGKSYSAEKLCGWKAVAEKNAHVELSSGGVYKKQSWQGRLSTLHYINVPRLSMLLPADSISDSIIETCVDGIPKGVYIIRVLNELERAVESAEIMAISLPEVIPPSEEIIGSVISFEQLCYTKNGVNVGSSGDAKWIQQFNEKHSPHFYTKVEASKFIFPYDPRWITTTTAYSDFRAGRRRFAGLGIVKYFLDDLTTAIVSPLVVGLPRNPV
ncbi:MAG: hypothetical protein O2807_08320 [bacterium]|nr:hypothetical protein [bacterium]